MDNIWIENGYDFKMNPYKVLAIKDQIGFIEVV
jgi:phosphatidylinositol kinase/protein kinase (PI-3  family)